MTAFLTRRAVLLAPVALAGCAAPPPPPAVLALQLIGGGNQNPDPSGTATAVAIRLYDLAATQKFDRADIFALIEREKTTLGTDGLGMEEFVIAPGENRSITHAMKPGAKFVGIIAVFRDIDRAVWRATQAVAAEGTTRLEVRTDGISVKLKLG